MDKVFEEIKSETFDDARRLAVRLALIIENKVVELLEDHSVGGDLAKSIDHSTQIMLEQIQLTIFSGVKHAVYLHEGTRPHMPPVNKIAKWVGKKGLTGTYSIKTHRRIGGGKRISKENMKLAWPIAMHIKKHGTKAFKFFDLALRAAEPQINSELQKFGYIK